MQEEPTKNECQATDAFKTLTDFFDTTGWNYCRETDADGLFLALSSRGQPILCRAQVWKRRKAFVFHSIFFLEVPETKWIKVVRVLLRANNTTPFGNFEIDKDRQIRFKTSVDFRKAELTQNMMRNAVFENIRAAHKFLPAFEAVLSNDVEADEAFEHAQTSDFLAKIRREFS